MPAIQPSRRALLLSSLALPALIGRSAWAQNYPSRPITYVSPYPPGGTNDLSARIIARGLAARLGQPVLVENRGGAGGTVGSDFVAKSPPDGHVLLNASSGNLTAAPQLLGAPYDPVRDFVPVGFVGWGRSIIATHPSVPVSSLRELIDYARAHPGQLNYGTAGIGTGGHIAGEYLKLQTGVDLVHVPYRGSAPAVNDAVAGNVQIVLDPLAAGHVREGRLRGLAFTGASEAPDLPDVPSITETFPDWELRGSWVAAAPARTPADIVARLSEVFLALAGEDGIREGLVGLGVEAQPLRPQEIAELLRRETELNARVIAAARIRV